MYTCNPGAHLQSRCESRQRQEVPWAHGPCSLTTQPAPGQEKTPSQKQGHCACGKTPEVDRWPLYTGIHKGMFT